MNRARTILIVEDTRELREDLALELRDAGYRVCEAGNGQSAIASFRRERPDLVICDFQLPDMDGLAAIKSIKRYDYYPDRTPIIIVSALSDSKIAKDLDSVAIERFLIKPLDYANLVCVIKGIFQSF